MLTQYDLSTQHSKVNDGLTCNGMSTFLPFVVGDIDVNIYDERSCTIKLCW